jgi:ribosomal protein S18 acetylase RimI-like enzyme
MEEKIYNLFKACFPMLKKEKDKFFKVILNKDSSIIKYEDNDELIAVSVINKDTITLLCVNSKYRHQGYGTKILKESEDKIKNEGYTSIYLGHGGGLYIMPGVPMNDNVHEFFIKRGYTHRWGDCPCYDLMQDLSTFNWTKADIGDIIDGITYRYYENRDKNDLMQAVSEVDFSWLDIFKHNESKVILAVKDDIICGFIMLGKNNDYPNIGSIGCTGTVPEYRSKGIGTMLSLIATRELKKQGFEYAYAEYTDLLNLYSRANYNVYIEYFMGSKDVR